MTTLGASVPYFSQWASTDRVPEILAGTFDLKDDPLWSESGAASQSEYAEWANHLCGMACLKMLLASRTGLVFPTMRLAQMALDFGAYQIKEGSIHGMIYAPFVNLAKTRFGLEAEARTGLKASEISRIMRSGSLFIASVHPSIRYLEPPPPKKGGHLVLVISAESNRLVFHNPSGHTPEAQRNVEVSVQLFDEYFAGRGIHILPPSVRANPDSALSREKVGDRVKDPIR